MPRIRKVAQDRWSMDDRGMRRWAGDFRQFVKKDAVGARILPRTLLIPSPRYHDTARLPWKVIKNRLELQKFALIDSRTPVLRLNDRCVSDAGQLELPEHFSVSLKNSLSTKSHVVLHLDRTHRVLIEDLLKNYYVDPLGTKYRLAIVVAGRGLNRYRLTPKLTASRPTEALRLHFKPQAGGDRSAQS